MASDQRPNGPLSNLVDNDFSTSPFHDLPHSQQQRYLYQDPIVQQTQHQHSPIQPGIPSVYNEQQRYLYQDPIVQQTQYQQNPIQSGIPSVYNEQQRYLYLDPILQQTQHQHNPIQPGLPSVYNEQRLYYDFLKSQPPASLMGHNHRHSTSMSQDTPGTFPYEVPGAERFVPLAEQFSDLTVINHHLSMFQMQQQAAQSAFPGLHQDMELMTLSSASLSNHDDMDLLHPPDAAASLLANSPSASWTTSWTTSSSSPSRAGSPSRSPDLQPLSTTPSISVATATSAETRAADLTLLSRTAPAVQRHRRRVQIPTVNKIKKYRPALFACTVPDCDKVFSRAYNLTSHMKTHSSERPFLCCICPLKFARRHDRERHVRLHTGEKPYACTLCQTGFMRNDALHRHQKLCGVAGSSFATQL